MDKLSQFVGDHMMLFASFVVILVLLILDIVKDITKSFQYLQPADATALINREDAVVLDIRSDKDFQSGHILNAMHVPMGLLDSKINSLEKYKEKSVIVSCRSGQTSFNACQLLAKNGFTKLYNLKGGMMAWENANLPLSKAK